MQNLYFLDTNVNVNNVKIYEDFSCGFSKDKNCTLISQLHRMMSYLYKCFPSFQTITNMKMGFLEDGGSSRIVCLIKNFTESMEKVFTRRHKTINIVGPDRPCSGRNLSPSLFIWSPYIFPSCIKQNLIRLSHIDCPNFGHPQGLKF